MKKNSRQIQKQQTKDALLKKAYEVFSEHGIMNTRIADIAQAAGVSHGTVFVHFRTQETLINEVVATYCQMIAARTHELAASSENMEELLKAHLTGIIEFERFYTRVIIENRMLPTGARDCWLSIQSAVSFHFSQVYARKHGNKTISNVPSYMLFNMWMGLVHYYLENGDLFAPEGNVIQRYQELLISSYLNLVMGN